MFGKRRKAAEARQEEARRAANVEAERRHAEVADREAAKFPYELELETGNFLATLIQRRDERKADLHRAAEELQRARAEMATRFGALNGTVGKLLNAGKPLEGLVGISDNGVTVSDLKAGGSWQAVEIDQRTQLWVATDLNASMAWAEVPDFVDFATQVGEANKAHELSAERLKEAKNRVLNHLRSLVGQYIVVEPATYHYESSDYYREHAWAGYKLIRCNSMKPVKAVCRLDEVIGDDMELLLKVSPFPVKGSSEDFIPLFKGVTVTRVVHMRLKADRLAQLTASE